MSELAYMRPCPACGLDAEVLDMWVWHDSDNVPVEHHEQRCPAGHYYCGLIHR